MLTKASFALQIEVAAQLEDIPFGVSTQSGGSIIEALPLSMPPQEMEKAYQIDLCKDATDCQTLLA